MSVQRVSPRTTAPEISARKGGEPIVSLTAYHAHTAAIADPYVDFLLVGDFARHGHAWLRNHPAGAARADDHAWAGGDARRRSGRWWWSTCRSAPMRRARAQAFHNAAKVMKETQCGAIKLEGGARMAETVHYLSQRGIPVMAHIGLTPQSINVLGGFKTQGRTRDRWAAIENDAKAVAEAGAFAVVLEAMAEPLARRITESVPIPTIGIGASAYCDGQILVMEDMLGLSPRVPKFVKEFGKVGKAIERAIRDYAQDVRSRNFPAPEHTYDVKD